MSGPLLGVDGIVVMFAVLFLLRIPAGFTMAIVGFFGVAYATSFTAALGMIGAEMWNIFSSYGLTVIPMFILVGEFVHYAGYNDSLYHATNQWFGHYRGGLAITTIMACAAFSAISGSNTATAATMSTVAIPAMKKYKYHPSPERRFRGRRGDARRPHPAQHRPGGLRDLHGAVDRQALLRERHSQRHRDGAHRGDGLVRSAGATPTGDRRRRGAPGRRGSRPCPRRSTSSSCSRSSCTPCSPAS